MKTIIRLFATANIQIVVKRENIRNTKRAVLLNIQRQK